MVSQIEMQIRAMDDGTIRPQAATRIISAQLGVNANTCRSYISAKRRGYASHRLYLGHVRKIWENYREETPQREVLTSNEDLDRMSSSGLDPHTIAERDEMLAYLIEGDVLDNNEKYVLTERFFGGSSFRQIACKIGVSQTEVFLTEKEALEKMRCALVRDGIENCA